MEPIYQTLRSCSWFAHVPDAALVVVSIAVPIVILLTIFPGIFAYTTLIERKALGRIQNRIGPNRVGRWGILQPIADGVKLLTKEDIVPARADKFVHFLAPVVAVIPAILLLAVLPIAPGFAAIDLNVGLLFVFAISTGSVLALFMGGWASRNKFSLLGAMRAVAQVVSYEVPMVLSVLAVVMVAGTISLVSLVQAQAGGVLGISHWFIWRPWGFVGFVLFTIGAMAETARTPFDIPEAESEIIAGYHTEYSGFKFALFQMGEYLASLAMAGVGATVFLGGYNGPGIQWPYLGMLLGALWFFLKLYSVIVVIIWIRGTWPRIRVDQLLELAWKVLLPMSVLNILAAGIYHFMDSKFLAWILTAVLLAVGWAVLARFSTGSRLERREYRYVS